MIMRIQQRLMAAFFLLCMPRMGSLGANPFVFDSSGRLPQVDAAFEAANKGGTIFAVKGSDSIVILTQSDTGKNLLLSGDRGFRNKKIRMLCKSITCCLSGIMADSLYFANKLFEEVANHNYAYGSDPSVIRLSKSAANILHERTLKNYRPLGVKAILCGWDMQSQLDIIEVDPMGNIHSCKASCIGKYSIQVLEELNESVDLRSLETVHLMRLAIKTLRAVVQREGGSEPTSSTADVSSIFITVIRPRVEEAFEADVATIESVMHTSADFEELKDAVRDLHQSYY